MKRGFLDSIPSFSLILIMVVLMTIGAALVPMVRLSYKPSAKQGSKLTITTRWSGASARVIEQEVVSPLEGVVSTVVGIESISSTSSEGVGRITINLKEGISVSAKRFEISSLIKQVEGSLPEEASYPSLTGGSVTSGGNDSKHLLTYVVNADMAKSLIAEYFAENIEPSLSQIEGVASVTLTGAYASYLDIEYDPLLLESYGVDASSIAAAIKDFLGKSNIIGDVDRVNREGHKERITLLLVTEQGDDLGKVPITQVGGRTIYLRDISLITSKVRGSENFYRINGMNTINMSIRAEEEANIITLSDRVKREMERLEESMDSGFEVTISRDSAKEIKEELYRLVRRTLLSLLILLLFVYVASRSVRYLSIIALTLAANVLIAVLFYYLVGVELHLFSLAGIAVSFGIIIDTSIVMVDHYNYYRNRRVFVAILAALLTTIGSLIIILFMPDYIKADLEDFAIVIIINLTVSLIISLLFIPAIIERSALQHIEPKRSHSRGVVWWSRLYARYIRFVQHRKWIYITLLVVAFGLPLHLLPAKVGEGDKNSRRSKREQREEREPYWYEDLYNSTIGGRLYQQSLKEPLEIALGGALRPFSALLDSRSYSRRERKTTLTITARLTEGNDGDGNGELLNTKMLQMDRFLSQFEKIERFTTSVNGDSGYIRVEFDDEVQKSAFPSQLEAEVISKALEIGGVDWSTYGVSERGFSNSLNIGSKSYAIELTGYNYDLLYRHAEALAERIGESTRAADVSVEDGSYRYGMRTEKGLALSYDKESVAFYNIDLSRAHNALKDLLNYETIGTFRSDEGNLDIDYRSLQRNRFDLWSLFNQYLTVGGRELRFSHISKIEERNAKRTISKKNQEYTVSVAFNYLGSYTLADNFTQRMIEETNSLLPVGFRAQNRSWGWYDDKGTQYWLILVVVVIIFFLCSILFESLRQPLVIISLIPISFIGTFLTFVLSGVNFGTGGFASLVLLSGLVVNAAIYLVNEYNDTLLRLVGRDDPVKLYVKAYNHKIIPILLTVLSTALGLVPFLLDGAEGDDFWLSFAVGSISGLLFSVVALVLVMPILMSFKTNKTER